jgi:hypothetical protein
VVAVAVARLMTAVVAVVEPVDWFTYLDKT